MTSGGFLVLTLPFGCFVFAVIAFCFEFIVLNDILFFTSNNLDPFMPGR